MTPLTRKELDAACYYNKTKAIPIPAYTKADVDTPLFAGVVATLQSELGLSVDGKCGPVTLTAIRDELLKGGKTKVLTKDDLIHLAEYTAPFEGTFTSCNLDGEYRGLFDKPPERYHSASKNKPGSTGRHIGLSFGYIQFTQDGGSLGKLLNLMKAANPGKFRTIFGPHAATLLWILNSPGRKSIDGRSPRVQKVGGFDLWEDYWVDRFKAAGRLPEFQRCQVELAVDSYMIPALKNCEKLRLKSARSIVIVFDRGVQYGPGGAYTKLLKPLRDKAKDTEHEFLRKFMHKYEDQRWGHRVVSLWRNSEIWDGPCDWSKLV